MKQVLLILLLAFLVLQIFQSDTNVSDEIYKTDILNMHAPTDSLELLLTSKCYDCHSNNTNYPWIANIQPAGWFIQKNVNEGKEHLNFSLFGDYTPEVQQKKLKEIVEVMEKNKMPIDSYQWYYKSASLTQQQRQMIIDWAKQLQDQPQPQPHYLPKPASDTLTTTSGYTN
jgi:hypothetical protein